MKNAATVFTWLGFSIEILASIIILSLGENVLYYDYYDGNYYTERVSYSAGVWFSVIAIACFSLAIALWRQKSVENGAKIACGVCTLIFVSLLGGILTLCIPEEELKGVSTVSEPAKNNTVNTMIKSVNIYSDGFTPSKFVQMSQMEKRDKLNLYKSMLQRGAITQYEYEQKVGNLGITVNTEKPQIESGVKPVSPQNETEKLKFTEEQRVDLLIKYKKLLDDGIISKEEFDKKKKDLLS